MTASMGDGIPLFLSQGLQNPHGSLWAERKSSIVVGLFSPGGLSSPFSSAEEGFIAGTRFEVEYALGLGIPVRLQ